MSYIHMKEEWKLFYAWLLLVIILLLSGCTNAPISVPSTYELIEPLGTIHKYRKVPLVGKSYYCIIHEYPETIYVVENTKRVRRWSGYDWR